MAGLVKEEDAKVIVDRIRAHFSGASTHLTRQEISALNDFSNVVLVDEVDVNSTEIADVIRTKGTFLGIPDLQTTKDDKDQGFVLVLSNGYTFKQMQTDIKAILEEKLKASLESYDNSAGNVGDDRRGALLAAQALFDLVIRDNKDGTKPAINIYQVVSLLTMDDIKPNDVRSWVGFSDKVDEDLIMDALGSPTVQEALVKRLVASRDAASRIADVIWAKADKQKIIDSLNETDSQKATVDLTHILDSPDSLVASFLQNQNDTPEMANKKLKELRMALLKKQLADEADYILISSILDEPILHTKNQQEKAKRTILGHDITANIYLPDDAPYLPVYLSDEFKPTIEQLQRLLRAENAAATVAVLTSEVPPDDTSKKDYELRIIGTRLTEHELHEHRLRWLNGYLGSQNQPQVDRKEMSSFDYAIQWLEGNNLDSKWLVDISKGLKPDDEADEADETKADETKAKADKAKADETKAKAKADKAKAGGDDEWEERPLHLEQQHVLNFLVEKDFESAKDKFRALNYLWTIDSPDRLTLAKQSVLIDYLRQSTDRAVLSAIARPRSDVEHGLRRLLGLQGGVDLSWLPPDQKTQFFARVRTEAEKNLANLTAAPYTESRHALSEVIQGKPALARDPELIRRLRHAQTLQAIEHELGAPESDAAYAELVAENKRAATFEQIHNSAIASVLQRFDGLENGLTPEQIADINQLLAGYSVDDNGRFSDAQTDFMLLQVETIVFPNAGLSDLQQNLEDKKAEIIEQATFNQVIYNQGNLSGVNGLLLRLPKTGNTLPADSYERVADEFDKANSLTQFLDALKDPKYLELRKGLKEALTPELFYQAKAENFAAKIGLVKLYGQEAQQAISEYKYDNAAVANEYEAGWRVKAHKEIDEARKHLVAENKPFLKMSDSLKQFAETDPQVAYDTEFKVRETAEIRHEKLIAKYETLIKDSTTAIYHLQKSKYALEKYIAALGGLVDLPEDFQKKKKALEEELAKVEKSLDIYRRAKANSEHIVKEFIRLNQKQQVYSCEFPADELREFKDVQEMRAELRNHIGSQRPPSISNQKTSGSYGDAEDKVSNTRNKAVYLHTVTHIAPVTTAAPGGGTKTDYHYTRGYFSQTYTNSGKGSTIEIEEAPPHAPAGASPEVKAVYEAARRKFYLIAAAQLIVANGGKTPTKDDPIRLKGDNEEELGALWSACVALGKMGTPKFGVKAISVVGPFNADKERNLVGRFKDDSTFKKMFKNLDQPEVIEVKSVLEKFIEETKPLGRLNRAVNYVTGNQEGRQLRKKYTEILKELQKKSSEAVKKAYVEQKKEGVVGDDQKEAGFADLDDDDPGLSCGPPAA